MQISRSPLWLAMAVILLVLGACAKKEIKMTTPKADYMKAKSMIRDGYYSRATMFLEKYASNHPYSHYTAEAELLRAYAAYKDDELPLAETICEEFIRRHPRHPDVAYAEYLLAMTHYHETSPPERDQSETHKAIKGFQRVIDEHPGTNYAKDAASHLQHLYNNLAKHETTVGEFYYKHKQYVAAVNRFQVVIRSYQTTPSIEPALYYLAASYAALGLKADARQTAMLLRANYPRGKWSEKAKALL